MSSDFVAVPHEVPFNACNLLLIEHQNLPFVPLQPVLNALGLCWKNTAVKGSLRRFKTTLIKVPVFYQAAISTFDCMPLRKLPAWLMAIELTQLNTKVRKKLMDYQNGCDDALWDHWLGLKESAGPVTLTYEGRRFRFRYIGSECWYVAADVVAALGLRDTASLLVALPRQMRLMQQIGGRRLATINQSGLEQTYLSSPPQCTERLRAWLANVTNDPQSRTSPIVSAQAFISKECSDMTMDYLARTSAALQKAGVAPVEWDEARAQHIAKNLPWVLMKHQRWLFTLSDSGVPQFSVVPSNAGVFTPEKILSWVRESDGADLELLPQLLHAIGERLGNR
jgi:prophage antirepressor-like protein